MMKTLWNTLFAGILVCVWTSVPLNPAHAASVTTVVKAGEELKAVFLTESTAAGKNFVTKLVNSEGKVVQTLIAEATPRAVLKNYLPSKISQQLKAAQAEVNAAAKAHAGKGFSVSRIMKEKLLSFPKETAGFFMALGAVMTFEMIFNEANNPVAYGQLAESQADPIGQLAFYFFMVANGVSTEPLQSAMMKGKLSPKFKSFVPFFGMGVGSVASNIVHELGHAPNMWQCARTLLAGKGLDPACDKAGETWNERGGATGLLNEWGPGLSSLIGSVIISGVVQKQIAKVTTSTIRGLTVTTLKVSGKWTAHQVVKVAGIEIATLFVPGGAPYKIVRWGGQLAAFVGNLVLFTAAEEKIRRPFAFVYHNIWDQAPALRDLEQDLISDLLRMKQSGWQPDPKKRSAKGPSEDLDGKIAEFKKQMGLWRQTNMAATLEAHANWEQKFGQLSIMYRGTYNFYQDFLGEYEEKNFGDHKDQYKNGQSISIIDRSFPLNGVSAETLEDFAMYIAAPDMVEGHQKLTIQKAIHQVSLVGLSSAEMTKMIELLTGLNTDNVIKLGQAIEQLNCQVFFRSDRALVPCKNDIATGNLLSAMKALRKSLGDPRPIWRAGEGYVNSFEKISENLTIAQNAKFETVWMPFSTIKLGDSLLASMAFGPDAEKGESVIEDYQGFKANFKPPKIVPMAHSLQRQRPTGPATMGPPRLFDSPLLLNGKVSYANTYDYLRVGNFRPSVMSAGKNNFSNWWETYVDVPYIKAWEDYENRYEVIVAEMMVSLWGSKEAWWKLFSKNKDPWWKFTSTGTQDSWWNRSTVSNGVMQSMQQEYNLYLIILGELLKDKMTISQGQVNSQLLDAPRSLDTTNLPLKKDRPNLFPFLRQNLNLQFTDMMNIQGIQMNEELRHEGSQNFIWQENALKKLSNIKDLLAQIRPFEVMRDGKIVTVTRTEIQNKEFQQAGTDASFHLKLIKDAMFTSNELNGNLQFSEFESKIIDLCFQGLDAIAGEAANIGLIANATSYVNTQNGTVKPRCSTPPAQAQGMVNRGAQYVRDQVAGCK